MATPFVSGVAALVWSVAPALTRDGVRQLLDSTADDLGTAGRDNSYGYGRVDALQAVQGAGGSVPPATPDFTVALSASTLTVMQGSSGQINVQVNAYGGFSNAVTLSAENLPPQVTSTFTTGTAVPPFSSTLTVSVGADAATGPYAVTVKGTDGTITKTQSFTLQIMSSSNQLSVSVSTNQPSYRYGNTVTITVKVTDAGANPISGAYVQVNVYNPRGALYKTFIGNSDANGYFRASFTISGYITTGTYIVKATATKLGYTSGAAQTSFTVTYF